MSCGLNTCHQCVSSELFFSSFCKWVKNSSWNFSVAFHIKMIFKDKKSRIIDILKFMKSEIYLYTNPRSLSSMINIFAVSYSFWFLAPRSCKFFFMPMFDGESSLVLNGWFSFTSATKPPDGDPTKAGAYQCKILQGFPIFFGDKNLRFAFKININDFHHIIPIGST